MLALMLAFACVVSKRSIMLALVLALALTLASLVKTRLMVDDLAVQVILLPLLRFQLT